MCEALGSIPNAQEPGGGEEPKGMRKLSGVVDILLF
jgi:hypothetical protein